MYITRADGVHYKVDTGNKKLDLIITISEKARQSIKFNNWNLLNWKVKEKTKKIINLIDKWYNTNYQDNKLFDLIINKSKN